MIEDLDPQIAEAKARAMWAQKQLATPADKLPLGVTHAEAKAQLETATVLLFVLELHHVLMRWDCA